MAIRRLAGVTAAAALGLTSLLGASGAAQAAEVARSAGAGYVKINLVQLYCENPSEGDDEAYLNVNAPDQGWKKIWPGSSSYNTIARGQTRSLSDANWGYLTIATGEERQFQLWDHDNTSSDDDLGEFTVHGAEETGKVHEVTIHGSGATYVIKYSLQAA
ncbi:hypothetical protein [Streptomyces griseoruber]|uniref:Uncharacterized protein n=1 Tax=Streptomyces griseoruber TaxID=1943 RepID=A0A101SKR3_9ACTN|nr:hypothetical protein [Streptomyces griseoruber]KUN75533.1 hypothetical protein AQJ64_41980 [Streptomyces griseoruber]